MTNTKASPQNLDLIIQGNIVLPSYVLSDGWIAIKEGKITGIHGPDFQLSAKKQIDAKGKLILPGVIDAHVHSYSNPSEGFYHASRSAAAGGVSTIIDMPYDAGRPVVSSDIFHAKRELVAKDAVTDVALLGTIKKKGGMDQIPKLAAAGACGFKMSLFETDPQRFPRIEDGDLLEAFSLVKETGLIVGVHAENDEIVKKETSKQIFLDGNNPMRFSRSRPKVAEAEASLRVMEFAFWTGVRLHIFHASFPRIFQMMNWYNGQGASISAETCTHYLTLSENDLTRLHGKAKINPPLRSQSDQEGLWKLCADGTVDIITSDHAPWPIDQKSNSNIFDCASGAPGVELLLPMIYNRGVSEKRISILDMVRMTSENPARLFGLFPRKGHINIGADADLVIFDPQCEWIVDERSQHSSAGWSPYHGCTLKGRVCQTFVRGTMVYGDNGISVDSGFGRFVAPVK